MPLQYDIQNQQSGSKDTLSTKDIVQQLQGQGETVNGISADGETINLQGSKGGFNIPTQQVLKQLGWTVNNVKPTDADYSGVNPEWRAAISVLPDDAMKEAYLTGKLKRAGIENPNVKGSGRDWYVFDPESSQYRALTNSPKWGAADLAEGAARAPEIIGSVLGTAGGAAGGAALGGGIGAIPGGAAGSVLGGGAGQALSAGVMSYIDPEVASTIAANKSGMLSGFEREALINAVAGGLGGAPGAIGNLARSGAGSTVAKGLGGLAETSGNIVGKVGKYIANPASEEGLGREASQALAANMIPGMGQLQQTGFLAQLPGAAAKGIAKGTSALGKSQFLQELAPDIAGKMSTVGENLLKTGSEEATSADVMRNLGEMTGFPNAGKNLGTVLKGAEDFGTAADKVATGVTRGVAGAGSGAGYGMAGVGRGMRVLGTAAQPYENRALMQYGAEEMFPGETTLQMRKKKANISPLSGNNI